MPDANGAELPAEKLARVRAEVAELRAAVSAQINTGAEKGTGVFRMVEIDFAKLEKRLKDKEAELARLEAIAAGDAAGLAASLGFVQLVTRGMPA